MSRIHVRPYLPTDRESVLPLYEHYWGAGDSAAVARHWDWLIDRPAGTPGPTPLAYVLEREGRLAGVAAGFHSPLYVHGRAFPLFWIVDYLVEPGAPGMMSGLRLVVGFERFRYDQLWAGFALPLTEPLWRRATGREGVHVLSGFGLLVRPLSAAYLARRWDSGGVADRLRIGLAAPLLRLREGVVRRRAGPGEEGVIIRPAERLDARLDPFFTRVMSEYPLITHRDLAYLDWRYRDHPARRYRFLTAEERDGSLRGYVVFAVDTEATGNITGRISDLLTARGDDRVRRCLVERAVAELQREGCEAVRIRDPGLPEVCRELGRAGFLRHLQGAETLFLYDRADPDIPRDLVREPSNWYLTYDRSYELGDL